MFTSGCVRFHLHHCVLKAVIGLLLKIQKENRKNDGFPYKLLLHCPTAKRIIAF